MAAGDVKGALVVRADDVMAALLKRNPGFPRAQVEETARLMAAFGATIQDADATSVGRAGVSESLDHTAPVAGTKTSRGGPAVTPRDLVEMHEGTGLGERMALIEGRRRLSAHALPIALEDWAGPVAGSTELAARFGIARSTLQDWRRNGAAIGLLKGTRKNVFPLAQFVDGRPVAGLAETVRIIGDPRAAWLWLVEPRRHGNSPIEDLTRGRIEAVLDAAREDFA